MHPSTLSPIPFLLLQPSPAPYLLPPPGRPCRQARAGATPSWLGREQSIWRGAAGRGPRARGGPDPVPFPARLSLGASPLTYTGLCYVGEAPSSHFIPSPQLPPGVFVQRSGRWGWPGRGHVCRDRSCCRGACLPARSWEISWGPRLPGAGPGLSTRVRGSARMHRPMHACACTCTGTWLCTPVCLRPAWYAPQGAAP